MKNLFKKVRQASIVVGETNKGAKIRFHYVRALELAFDGVFKFAFYIGVPTAFVVGVVYWYIQWYQASNRAVANILSGQ